VAAGVVAALRLDRAVVSGAVREGTSHHEYQSSVIRSSGVVTFFLGADADGRGVIELRREG
jgi:hypothetical protein